GVAELQPHETPEQWFQRADELLYQAKQSGRNRMAA
ncbi:MAG: diguanylate cyclase domain-containing protein, partial [Fimbriimonadales bacterium]